MQGPKFLYFLQNEAGQFYWMNGDIMDLSSVPIPLQFTPDGWQEISIFTEWNLQFFGLQRTYGAPQNFVEDAATILKTLRCTRSIEEKVYLLILEQDIYFSDTEYGYFYKLLCKCQIDLSQYSHSAERVGCNVLEGDLMRLFKANEAIVYELPLDVPEAVTVLDDGLNLQQTGHFQLIEGLPMAKSFYGTNFFLPFIHLNDDGQSTGINFQSVEAQNVSGLSFTDKINSDDWGVQADPSNTGPVTLSFVGTIKFKCNRNDLPFGFRARFLTSTQTLANQNNYQIFTSAPAAGSNNTFPVNMSITLQPGERLYCEGIFFGGTTGAIDIEIEFLPDSLIDVSFINRFKATVVKALPPLYILQQLVSKMTNGKYTATSTLFSNDATLLLTSGDGLRGLPGSVIKTCFDDFFASYNVPYCIGMQIVGNTLMVERKRFFVDPSATMPLGEGSQLKHTPAVDMLFGSVQVGYPNQNYNIALGDTNGRGEFNMTHVFSAPITVVNTVLDLISKYRADMYGAEFARINLDGKLTADSSSDNDTFFLKVKGQNSDGNFLFDRSINASCTGLIDVASAFNIPISPKNCLLAHGYYLRSCLAKMDNLQLVWASSDKPTALVINGVGEKDNVTIGSLAAPIFQPEYLEFITEVPENYVDLIGINPIRLYQSTYKQGTINLSGFAIKTGIAPNDNKEQAYKLLAAPDMDLTQLINVYE